MHSEPEDLLACHDETGVKGRIQPQPKNRPNLQAPEGGRVIHVEYCHSPSHLNDRHTLSWRPCVSEPIRYCQTFSKGALFRCVLLLFRLPDSFLTCQRGMPYSVRCRADDGLCHARVQGSKHTLGKQPCLFSQRLGNDCKFLPRYLKLRKA